MIALCSFFTNVCLLDKTTAMMKTLFCLFCVIVCCKNLHAQDTIHLRHLPKETILTDRPPQALYAEVFGRSIDFSINYDSRFSKRVDGWGFSAGFGVISGNIENRNYFSLPVSANYLAGRNGKYLEVGAGLTYFNAKVTDTDEGTSGGNTIMGTFIIGYRNQPLHGGFMFRTGISPIILRNNFIPYYPYVSFGYNF